MDREKKLFFHLERNTHTHTLRMVKKRRKEEEKVRRSLRSAQIYRGENPHRESTVSVATEDWPERTKDAVFGPIGDHLGMLLLGGRIPRRRDQIRRA